MRLNMMISGIPWIHSEINNPRKNVGRRESPLESMVIMKVLVTGIDGYIGTVLGQELIKAGHNVVGLDTEYYADAWLYDMPDFKKDRKQSSKTLEILLKKISLDLMQLFT